MIHSSGLASSSSTFDNIRSKATQSAGCVWGISRAAASSFGYNLEHNFTIPLVVQTSNKQASSISCRGNPGHPSTSASSPRPMLGAAITASTAASIPSYLDRRMSSHQLLTTTSSPAEMHSDSSPVPSSDDPSSRNLSDQQQEMVEAEGGYDYDYDYDYDLDSDSSLDPWLHDDDDESSPSTAHLIGDHGTLRLPSGKSISARSATTSSRTRPPRRNRKPLPQPLPKPRESVSTTPDERQDGSPSPPFLSRREEKRHQTFVVRHAELRKSDVQSLAGLPFPQRQALLATTHKQIAKAERAEKRFTGKMDGLGNIKISERFVNDVPGGKAHRNRFFAR